MPGILDVFLHVDAGVVERLLGFHGRLLQAGLERDIVAGDPHSLAAAASRGLDQDRVANLRRDGQGRLFTFNETIAAGDQVDLGLFGDLLGRHLVTELAHRLGGRADELDVATAADFGEVLVLGQESIAGMDGLHVADFGGADDVLDQQVTAGGLGRTDADGFAGELQIVRAAVRLTADGHRFDSHLAAGAENPESDLASIGDQDALKHAEEQSVWVWGEVKSPEFGESAVAYGSGESWPHAKQRLAELDGITAVHQDRGDRAVDFRGNLVEHLHRFNQTDDGFGGHGGADRNERRFTR